ncbi:MAG: CBS domain-containing protein [Alphaproteobacteria bacterium]
MTAAMILKDKGTTVHKMECNATLCDAARKLTELGIGAVVVVNEDDALMGVFSERDIVRALAEHGPDSLQHAVRDFMSDKVVTCTETDTVSTLSELMTDRRVRHIPVMRKGELVGIVSIGDVVKRRLAEKELETDSLRQYITT